jgi:hypothetical protein
VHARVTGLLSICRDHGVARRGRQLTGEHQLLHASSNDGGVVHVVRQLGIQPLVIGSDADRDPVVDSPRDRRIEIQRRDLVVQSLEAADPAAVIDELEAERCVDAESDGEVVTDGHHEVGGRNEVPVARIATFAAERLREGWRGAGIAKLGADPDAAGAHGDLGFAQCSHSCGIEEHRGRVVCRRGSAGEGCAQAARALFEQCEAGRASDRRYER